MLDLAVSLDDKYAKDTGPIYVSGTQAFVRLLIEQARFDRRRGLKTAGFVSGYRGSPLASLDQEAWRAAGHLAAHDIVFTPGLNEDLAATSVWGSQQVGFYPGAKFDGVFGLWYGKAPGVDRCGDVFKHANFAGSARHGGVLALAGDDHAAKTTSTALQSEPIFAACMMPTLAPAGLQDFVDLGLFGWALSRFSGLWVGFKVTEANVGASGIVSLDPARPDFRAPDIALPPGGLNARWPDDRIPQEARLRLHKIPAALAFARANGVDKRVFDPPKARLGIVAAGKSYLDAKRALDELGIDESRAAALGVRLLKLALVWPVEPETMAAFAHGLDEIVVVEEKAGFVEDQIKAILYDRPADRRPRIVGKADESGRPLFPAVLDFDSNHVAAVIARRLLRLGDAPDLRHRLAALEGRAPNDATPPALARSPFFCSGCPHNTSTRVPEGSLALAGIGCHSLAILQGRAQSFTHMGGEGAQWIGLAPFTSMPHVFQNVGDGTYYHSAALGIRAAVAAKVNITFKLLYNDAVAMTGGQPVEGAPTVPQITRQLAAEGVARIVVVSDDPEKYPTRADFAPGTAFRHRDELDAVQRELRETPGVTALVYDQTCAAEKRRRRKRGTFPDPARRVFINPRVCEGCGDCGQVSNCVSVVPVETKYGLKRAIDQSACNKDFSCLKGFCPSFVTVEGGQLAKRAKAPPAFDHAALPAPSAPADAGRPWSVLVTGVGGTGVVTIGAVLGMAAHLDGKACVVADIVGMSQKNGAVFSQLTFGPSLAALSAAQIAAGDADALVACDLVAAAMPEAMGKLAPGRTRAVVNLHRQHIGAFAQNPDLAYPADEMRRRLDVRLDAARSDWLEATRLALALVGDSIGANMFMAGAAFQRGLIPLSAGAIERAIALNGAAVAANLAAFRWGRRAIAEPDAVNALLADDPGAALAASPASLAALVDDFARELAAYQDAAYAGRYRRLVERAVAAEASAVPGREDLGRAVARYGFKLMAYKDEYEVARLYTDTRFLEDLKAAFDGTVRLKVHLAPPLFAPRDPETGLPQKRPYGAFAFAGFRVLKRLKRLRGTRWDPFGRTAERRGERQLIADYEALVTELAAGLSPANHALAVELASLPERIRGFGHVKARHLAEVKPRWAALLTKWRGAAAPAREAA
jgi:indolepyruvate ferredoxin oxidoreductase